jgi:hypothetical protein
MIRPLAGDGGAVDGGHADAAAADHSHRLAGGDLGGVDGGAVAGDDAAADQRRPVERKVVADLHQRILVHQHHLGVGGEIGEGMQLLAVEAQALGGAGGQLHLGVGADEGPPRRAVVAGAAEHRQAGDDVVALFHIADLGAHFLHDARRFVAQDHGQGMGIEALDEMQIRVAQPGEGGADQHLACRRLVDGDLLDDERLVDLV